MPGGGRAVSAPIISTESGQSKILHATDIQPTQQTRVLGISSLMFLGLDRQFFWIFTIIVIIKSLV